MGLIENLNAIENCKNDIKIALEGKGVVMDGVKFSEYAGIIKDLKFESGDSEPSTPGGDIEPADYIYSNGYIEGGEINEIINLVPYEIELDSEGKFTIELTCPAEISITNYVNYDIIFTVEIPEKYSIVENGFEIEGINGYEPYVPKDGVPAYKPNPRYETIVRNGVTYNSFVRGTNDADDYEGYGTEDAASDPLYYRITIEENKNI